MVYKCSLSPELQKKAKEELNEDPERRDADIEHIRQWLLKQPHITAKIDDWTILRFLRGCKFSLERTKEKFDMYYTCKTMVPEWFANRDPQDKKIREILELGMFLPLPGHDAQGRKVILVRGGIHDPSKISQDEFTKAALMIVDILTDEDIEHTVCGIIQVMDLKGFSPSHALQFTPTLMKKAMTVWQDGFPTRPKGLHYINTIGAFDKLLNFAKSFMKEKMRLRLQVHGSNMDSLHKFVPKEILPAEYGGMNGTIEDIIDYWCRRVDERRDWLLEDEIFKVDESKRPGKPKTISDLFGIEGSFRKLNVD